MKKLVCVAVLLLVVWVVVPSNVQTYCVAATEVVAVAVTVRPVVTTAETDAWGGANTCTISVSDVLSPLTSVAVSVAV